MNFIGAKHFFAANRNLELGAPVVTLKLCKKQNQNFEKDGKSSNLSFIHILTAKSESSILEVLIV